MYCEDVSHTPINGKQMINKDAPPPSWAVSPVSRPDRRKGISRKAINRNKGLRITGIRLCLHCNQKNTAKERVIEVCDNCTLIQ
ncbi:hypothetical protein CAEBREN_23877 [Caenorhabditis brenneri]|uniref:Uncharacterized protein n=1 Tax=Caenorhabditis brenneri TaxID=135651 RepID=G0PKY7_CAEBE|nr:hypothetical protein CAEBREN_23877 [Caenorhabditis brenneri]